MGLFKSHDSLRTSEQNEAIKGATPYLNERAHNKLPENDAPEGLLDFDEGFKPEDKGPYEYVEVEDIAADEDYEDKLINEIDRRREQSQKDKNLHLASKN